MKLIMKTLVFLTLAMMSCSKTTQVVRVRFENQTMWSFTNIYVNDHHVGDLGIGATSDYLEYSDYNLHDNKPEPESFSGNISATQRLAFVQPTSSNPALLGKIEKMPPGDYTIVLKSGYYTQSTNTYISFEFK